MRSYLFFNPSSGHYSENLLNRIVAKLHSHGIFPELFRVLTPSDVAAHCNTINKKHQQNMAIIAGGDGTINAVVNCLNPDTATLAVLPFGTSNILAAEIGITSLADGVARIAAGKTRSLSVGLLGLKETTLRFVLMAGIGLDGAVVRDVWPLGKRFLRQGAYALSAIKHMMAWDPTVFEISTPVNKVICHTAIICNASRYGGNFILSPGSSPFTPGLSAVCTSGNKRRTYLNNAHALFGKSAGTNKDLIRIQSSFYDISGNHPIQIDGDFVGYAPARISECNNFARIIV